MISPYTGIPENKWKDKTLELVKAHPLNLNELIDVVFESWDAIMRTKIGDELQIGVDIFPQPQIIGNYLHELIPVFLEKRHPGIWARDINKNDKDLVYLPDSCFSAEIKTSSNPNNIYGNASYGQEDSSSNSRKNKDGYYIAVNFEKFTPNSPNYHPGIQKIRFGWLDHSDWHSQGASSGQQSSIKPFVRDNKLLLIYDKKKGGKLI